MNETHRPDLQSWVTSANEPETDFPIQNLPFGVFRQRGREAAPRVGVAIGDRVLDLDACFRRGLLGGPEAAAAATCTEPALNRLMSLGPAHWSALRLRLSRLLRADSPELRDRADLDDLLLPSDRVGLLLPCTIGDYTDFYASIHHARTVGSLFRPDNPLLPNYKFVPIAYHGRSSSIVVSGTQVRRPLGQILDPQANAPVLGPSRLLDYEVEVGFFIGPGNPLGEPIPVGEAENHLFGLCLVNDWSARDIQKWEYQPLGPFLGKNFATTISPWVVTLEALAPFRAAAAGRAAGDPAPLPYLALKDAETQGAIDLELQVSLRTARMETQGAAPALLGRSNLRDLYWTPAQMIAHHASNGCNLRPGDLLASGTVSGETAGSRGCLLELTGGGRTQVSLPNGEVRSFLEDGDEVILRGRCRRPGCASMGFGACRGRVVAAAGGAGV
jgi:fumarylacetoacetase